MTDLGFDPTIERVIEDREIQYNIHCGKKWYRVLETLSDFKAARCLSRATRVWKVRELKDKTIDSSLVGDILVIKDVWIDENARSEKEILDDIISKINTVHSIGPVSAYSHFIKIEEDERVCVVVDGQGQDDCTSSIFRGQALPMQGTFLHISQYVAAFGYARRGTTIPGSPSPASGSATSLIQNHDNRIIPQNMEYRFKKCTPKQHRRILYAECGVSLNTPEILTDHKIVLKALSHAATGMVTVSCNASV